MTPGSPISRLHFVCRPCIIIQRRLYLQPTDKWLGIRSLSITTTLTLDDAVTFLRNGRPNPRAHPRGYVQSTYQSRRGLVACENLAIGDFGCPSRVLTSSRAPWISQTHVLPPGAWLTHKCEVSGIFSCDSVMSPPTYDTRPLTIFLWHSWCYT